MSTRSPTILSVDPTNPQPDAIAEAARVLAAGGLVAFPTETVYGLGARALDRTAVARVFQAKQRPRAHPLILHLSHPEQARAYARAWSAEAERLAEAFWPGPLTLVVDRTGAVPDTVTGGGATVALRVPAHPIARALVAAVGEPIAAPSANRYQTVTATTAAHVLKSLGADVDLILDGGACPGGIESTVIDVRAARARLLRPGGVDLAALRRVAADIDVEAPAPVLETDAVRPSPGMDAKHYAPRARVVLAGTRRDAEREALARRTEGAVTALVTRGEPAEDVVTAGLALHVLPDEPRGYGRALFATLHACDDAGADVIVVEAPPADEAWLAVRDRLRRAGS